MQKSPVVTKKAALKAIFQSDQPHPEMGNLSAISVVKALKAEFFDQEFCLEFILREILKGQGICPHCQAILSEKNRGKLWKNQQVYCPICKKKFQGTKGTPIAQSSIKASQVICMAVLCVIGFSDSQVARAIGSNHHTVKRWRKLLSHT